MTETHYILNDFIFLFQSIFDQGKVTMEERKSLISGYDMVINPEKMGERFKFLALHTGRPAGYTPAGFKSLT